MLKRLVEAAVEKEIGRRTIRPDRKLTLEGYHPLPEIMGTLYEWVFIPFRGAEILVEIRYPRSTQLPDVDRLFHLSEEYKKDKKLSRSEMIEILNMQEECCRAVLNRPTFEELEKAIYEKDHVLQNSKKTLSELREKLNSAKDKIKDSERIELAREIERLELFAGYILPDDTMIALLNIALGSDISDIKKVTKEKLIAAYAKARLYGGKPSDFVPGLFTDFDRENINDYCTALGGKEEVKRRGR